MEEHQQTRCQVRPGNLESVSAVSAVSAVLCPDPLEV